MDCIFDKEKLAQVLSDFYSSTGIAVTLYDSQKQVVATSPIYSPYCALIRSRVHCVEHCDRSDLTHMKEVGADHTVKCYTCHAGLMETILPIEYEGIVIAYLQIGQFRDTAAVYSSPEHIAEAARRYGLPIDELRARYEELPLISEVRLAALFRILGILIRSFWEDGLIAYRRSMLSIRIEQYITAHLTEQIRIEALCREFSLSKNALYRLFREEFQATVNEFILQKRLNLACELLRSESTLSVTEISARCGFSDYNYFIRLFKNQRGITPLQFRKRMP
jgi:AraC-like DNA-binding protein